MAIGRKSQVIFLSIMMSVLILIVIMILAPVLRDEIGKATNTTYLNSSNSNLPIANQATVIILDMGIFYYLSMLIAVSLAYISGKKSVTGAITAIMVFIVVAVLITPLKDLIIYIRDSSHLDCANTGISIGAKMACITVDLWLFYFFVIALTVAISYIFMETVVPKIKGEAK